MPRRSTTPDDVKARILAIFRRDGLAAAYHESAAFNDGKPVARSTIRDWAAKAGIEPGAVTMEATATTEAANRASNANRGKLLAEHRDALALRLMALAQGSLDLQLDLVAAMRQRNDYIKRGVPIPTPLLNQIRAFVGEVEPRDVVGIGTRAIGDLIRLQVAAARDDGTFGEDATPPTIIFASPAFAELPKPKVWELSPATGKLIDPVTGLSPGQEAIGQ